MYSLRLAPQIEQLNTYQLLTAKPMVYLANLSAADYIRKKNKWLGPIAECVSIELELPAHTHLPPCPYLSLSTRTVPPPLLLLP